MAYGYKTGGRRAGTPNRATADLRAAASVYAQEALDILVNVVRNSNADVAKIAAARELLDRGFGKARPLTAEDDAAETECTPQYDFSKLTRDERETLTFILTKCRHDPEAEALLEQYM